MSIHSLKSDLKHIDLGLLSACCLFVLLTIRFIFAFPFLDGEIDFIKSYDFFIGGFPRLFTQWGSVHPPLKLVFETVAFSFGGVNQFSFNLVGIFIGILGIIAIYFFTEELLGKPTARLAAFFLAAAPMYLATSVFSLIDFEVTVFVLLSFLFYAKQHYLLYALAASCLVLIKETGAILPAFIFGIEIAFWTARHLKTKQLPHIPTVSLSLIPLGVFFLWLEFIKQFGQAAWHDWIFAPTAKYGAIYTIGYNFLTLNILNKYAFQSWIQFFLLNFSWVYWLIILIGVFFCIKRFRTFIDFSKKTPQKKTYLAVIFFCLFYFFGVLSFQTYTIPRYALPLIPFIVIVVARILDFLEKHVQKLFIVVFAVILTVLFVQNFSSIDPLSKSLYSTTEILGQTLYNMPNTLDGNDGITYNMQSLEIAATRTQYIQNKQYSASGWLFPDPNNDTKLMKILHLSR